MSDYVICKICRRWGWDDKHKCPPAYGVRPADYDRDEEIEVYADSPEEAAREYLSDHYADFDYPRSMTVIVNDWRANHWGGHEYTYEVTVEMEPRFYAECVKDEPVKQEEE